MPGSQRSWRVLGLGLVLGMLAAGGCVWEWGAQSRSPLRPAQKSPDAVAIEILFVRCSYADAEVNGALWSEIDEQRIPIETRRKLAANGFRVGIVGGQIPLALEKLMSLSQSAPQPDESQQANLEENDAKVTGRMLQLRAGKRTEIQTSRVFDELPILFPQDGQLVGRTFPKAQGVFEVRAFPESDGRIKLDLLPELQFGEPSNRYRPSQEGVWLIEMSRNREVFEHLRLETLVSPGEFLLITGIPDRAGSLGDHFFSDRTTSPREQKLLLLRVAAKTVLDEL